MSLKEIGELLAAAPDRDAAIGMLNRFLDDLEALHSSRRLLIRHVHAILRKEDAKPTGPFTVVFHGIIDDENDGPIEAMLGCPGDIGPTDVIGVRTEPAHDQAYTTITKTQWEFPAILAAYDAVACSPEATARPGSQLSCREVYVAEPDDIADDGLICDIAFPLG